MVVTEALAGALLESRDVLVDLAVEACGNLPAAGEVGAAGLGRDREPVRNGHAECGHLGEADPLPPEKLTAPTRVLGEVEDVAHLRGESTLDRRVGRILAMGGRSDSLEDALLELGGPRVCLVPTASGDESWQLVRFYESFAHRAEATHISFNPWPPANVREHILRQDVVYVSGGNTANALAIWRAHGFDAVLREAWEQDVLLSGWSAGMICWFEAGVTDSFGPELEGMRDGLGFLAGSACPHYDGEESRRPAYRALVDGGFPAGYAADDGAALHFVGGVLREVIASLEGACGYRVEPGAESPIAARLL